MKNKAVWLAGLGFMLSGTGVLAAPITYNLTTAGLVNPSGSNNTYYASTQGGITLTAKGYENFSPKNSASIGSSVTYGSQRSVLQDTNGTNSQGLGVSGNGNTTDGSNSGNGDDEAIEFTFSQNVSILNVVFNSVGSSDDFDFIVDGILTLDEESTGNGGAAT